LLLGDPGEVLNLHQLRSGTRTSSCGPTPLGDRERNAGGGTETEKGPTING
jgi:hypothetical protein